jgi:peptide chain release factor 1
MEEKLYSIIERFKFIEDQINDPEISSDIQKYKELSQEKKQLQPIAEVAFKYLKLIDDLRNNKEMIDSPDVESELKDMAQEEVNFLNEEKERIEEEIRFLLIPKDPMILKTVFLKSELVQVETKQVYLQVIYTECTKDIPK